MTQEFERGDVVCLKSGGPPMTVYEPSTINNDVGTIHISDDGLAIQSRFPPEVLVKIKVRVDYPILRERLDDEAS